MAQGIQVLDDEPQLAQRMGLRTVDGTSGVQIKTVLRGSAAEQAGMAAGDEWLGVEVGKARQQAWRLNKLDELPSLLGAERQMVALISRDKRLLRLPVQLPKASTQWRLALPADRAAGQWPAK
jgi:predicted metalloprotease with PDZ domain